MKKKILISSVLTILLCLALIVGSTFALFTSTSNVNIAVTSGKVEVTATVDENSFEGWSEIETDVTEAQKNATVLTFENGGTAEWKAAESQIVLDRITPGDFVKFTVKGTNSSNVAVKYRYVIKTDDLVLASALTMTLNDAPFTFDANGEYYVTGWVELDANEDDIIDPVIVIGMDDSVGNGYTDADGNFVSYHDRTANITITLEAIQGNG